MARAAAGGAPGLVLAFARAEVVTFAPGESAVVVLALVVVVDGR